MVLHCILRIQSLAILIQSARALNVWQEKLTCTTKWSLFLMTILWINFIIMIGNFFFFFYVFLLVCSCNCNFRSLACFTCAQNATKTCDLDGGISSEGFYP